MGRPTVATTLPTLLMWLISATPSRSQGVGAIGGTITDASGAVLPGSTVTLSNPGMIGGNQEAVTSERGTFLFSRLVPGRYSVRADLSGFTPARQDNVIVNADVTARVDLQLEVGLLKEAITVSGQAPLLDTTSALKQTTLSAETLQTLPNRIDVWGIAKVVPSISLNKVDVGGSESFLQSTPVLRGASNQNAFMIDGMDVAWVNNLSVLYFDPYVYEETNFQLGGGSAEVS
ncbi:MAG: carboxypeptidase regulatory-like domain-containing protein [Acidimicrobiia bacterium]|nr:carboxypeptidase regulatory-like domain-containing protein [Acidimicrobiia bacterium]